MKFERRLTKLEEHLLPTDAASETDAELTEWFKSHPTHLPLVRPESNGGIAMPEYLSNAFQRRVAYVVNKMRPRSGMNGLLAIWEHVYP